MPSGVGKAWVLCARAAVAAVALFGCVAASQAQQSIVKQMYQVQGSVASVQVPLHKSRIIQLRSPVAQVSVGNPEVADILVLKANQLYVVGRSLGSTNVVLWDGANNVIATLDVEITHDLDSLKVRLHEMMPEERGIQVRSSKEAIVLSGEASSVVKMEAAMKLASSFLARSTDGKEAGKVMNLMQVGGAQQVMLEVKVAEIRRDVTKRFGINFNAVAPGSPWTIGAVNGGARFPDARFGTDNVRVPIFGPGEAQPIGPVIDEFAPNDLSITDKGFFASFLSKNFLFNAVIDAAKNNGLAKILAEPTLTTLTGQEAQFRSGGEFPIPVPQGDGQVTIQFKDFGVGLNFLPVVLDSGRISLKVNISVSELTSANSVVVGVENTRNVFAVPALSSRSSSSTLELSDGQTMAIAGLINDSLREQVNKFPGLAELPILGQLFRSQEFIKGQTELVIFVTPHFARPMPRELIRMPTDAFVEPNDLEFYLLGRMEGTRRKAPALPAESLQKGGVEAGFGHEL